MKQGDREQAAQRHAPRSVPDAARGPSGAPGKTTLTSRLPRRGAVQRKPASAGEDVRGPDLGVAAGQGGPGGGGPSGGGIQPRRVEVGEGDTLQDVAGLHLGSAEHWPQICELNPGLADNDPNLGLPAQLLAVPPSEAEISAQLAQVEAEAKGGAGEPAAEEGAQGEEGAGEQEAPGGAGDAGAAGAVGGQVAGAGGAVGVGGAGGALPGPSADGALPFWAEVESSFSWDEEVAQYDTFRSAAAECGAGGGAGVPGTGAMVANALLQGAGAGLVLGGVSLGIDTAINMGSSRIPMLAGFVEIGQMVYGVATDPAAWSAGKLNGLLGNDANGKSKYGAGWRKLTSDDPLDKIEGAVDLFDGLKSTIDTLSSICWIVAGVGFILSWIPGLQWLIPFVALAAKWGTVLGAVATVSGAVLSILRGLLITFRSVDLLTGESDPTVAREKAERLQADTQAFTQAFTERAGNSAREGIAGSPHRRQAADPPPRGSQAPAERPSALRRAVGFATSSALGTAQFSTRKGDRDAGEDHGALRQVGIDLVDVSSGTFHAAKWRQTTGQRIDALESRDVDVYISQSHRDYVNHHLGQRAADPGSDQGALGQSRRRVVDAEERRDQARAEREQADAALRQSRQDLDATHQRLQDARAQNAPARQHQEQQVAEAKALVDSYAADVRTIEVHMDTARTTLEMTRAAHQAHPDSTSVDGVSFRAKVEQAEADVARLQRDLELARGGHQEAQALHREERAALDRVLQVERDAQGDVDRAAAARDAARSGQEQSAQAEGEAESGVSRARGDVSSVEKDTSRARKNFDKRMQNASAYIWWRDVSGKGTDRGNLYGHNKGSAVTGFATGHIMGNADEEGTLGHSVKSNVQYHLQSEAPDDAAIAGGQPAGDSAEATPGPDHQAQVCAQLAALVSALPPPPLEVPGRVDGAAKTTEELLAEEAVIAAQRVRSSEARGVAEKSLGEIAGTHGLIEGGRGAAGAMQAEAGVLLERQSTLQAEAGRATAEAGNAAGQAGEGQGLVAGFAGKFIELMGRVPSRFVDNAGEGAGGAQDLQEAGSSGPEISAMARETATAAGAKAGAWQGETRAVQDQVQGSSGALDDVAGAVDQREQQTRQGLAELDQADADIAAALAEIAAEKARLTSEHGADVATGRAWTEQHRGAREAGLAELDAVLAEAEAAPGAAGQE